MDQLRRALNGSTTQRGRPSLTMAMKTLGTASGAFVLRPRGDRPVCVLAGHFQCVVPLTHKRVATVFVVPLKCQTFFVTQESEIQIKKAIDIKMTITFTCQAQPFNGGVAADLPTVTTGILAKCDQVFQ